MTEAERWKSIADAEATRCASEYGEEIKRLKAEIKKLKQRLKRLNENHR